MLQLIQEIPKLFYVIFEKLSSSKSISNIYGYCGGSIITEAAIDITYHIVPDFTKQLRK